MRQVTELVGDRPHKSKSFLACVPLLHLEYLSLDRHVADWLAVLAAWILISGLDDLVLEAVCLVHWLEVVLFRRPPHWPSEPELDSVPPKRIAIFVPLWREHRVIRGMLEHNIAASRYANYCFFIGAYPNDGPTLTAVREAGARLLNIHLAVCPHDGPTSKADCLNWIYQRMLLYEEEHGDRFDIVVTHDAEDLIHPEALRWINYFSESHEMVQIPVLALPTPLRELTHGVYCDDFAECQIRDLPVRQALGGFIPSNGVGAGFSRASLQKLAAAHGNRIFEPESLTEDYENGFRLHRLGCSQLFVPLGRPNGTFVATREYFPRSFAAAVRQRTRWIMGIGLQSWERHGWRETAGQLYWFWRDRKGLVGNLIAPPANLLFLYGAATWMWSWIGRRPWGLAAQIQPPLLLDVYLATLSLQLLHLLTRAACVSRIYGPVFALGVPIRAIWANWINFLATVHAYRRYFGAKLTGQPLVWLKTEHAYPNRAALMEHKRRIGEVLVGSSYVEAADLEAALAAKPSGMRIGEYLVKLGKLTEQELYEALSLQQNLPLGKPAGISLPATRSLPAAVARKWRVLPFRVAEGHLFVAASELPSEQMHDELRRFSSLELRFHLVTPAEFEELEREYLPSHEAAQTTRSVPG